MSLFPFSGGNGPFKNSRSLLQSLFAKKQSRRRDSSFRFHTSTSTVPAAIEILEDRTMLTDPRFKTGVIEGVGKSWQTVFLNTTYESMVVVTTVNSEAGDPSVVARIRNASEGRFEIKLQRADGTSDPISGMKVHYVAVEEGVYTEANDGINMEAVKFNSTETDHTYRWIGEQQTYQNSYTAPVVLGQVMTENDPDFTSFWARGASRLDPPSPTDFYVGKHVGEDSDRTRADETIGYIVMEAGAGTVSGMNYTVGVGEDTVWGTGNLPAYTYDINTNGTPISAIASIAGMDGPDGGWAVLYGSDPLSSNVTNNNTLDLAVQEDQFKDAETAHGNEQLAYLVFSKPFLSPELRRDVVENVTDQWQTVTLDYTYDSMVVVATVNAKDGDPPVVARIRNAEGNSFELKVQRTDGSTQPVSGITVYYFVVEEGIYNEEEHGVTLEAVKYNSTVTDSKTSWQGEEQSYQNSYTAPVVLGQVMTDNDPKFSVFWSRGETRFDAPSITHFYAGKHVAEDSNKVRADETVGYIVIEQGEGTIGHIAFSAGLGNATVEGIGNSPAYTYEYDFPSYTAVVSSAGMNGVDGGWATLYGDEPVKNNELNLAIMEDQLFDAEQRHAPEQVAYISFYKSAEYNLSNLLPENGGDGSQGFVVFGEDKDEYMGDSVSSAGDINGDGYDDILLYADGYKYSELNNAGVVYVIFGKNNAFDANFDLSTLNGSNGFILKGVSKLDMAGRSISSAGDINGDGIDDLLIGAPHLTPNGDNKGDAYVVFGKNTPFDPVVELSELNGNNGFVMMGIDLDDHLGKSVSAAGDLNNDGYDDIIIGASRTEVSGVLNVGSSYVLFGKGTPFSSTFDLNSLDGSNGFVISGIGDAGNFGTSVSGAGDINGDGYPDLLIGAPFVKNETGVTYGYSYLIFGTQEGYPSAVNLSTLDGNNGFVIEGSFKSGWFGATVTLAGDLNGDGFDDIAIGAPRAGYEQDPQVGVVYVIYGKESGFNSTFNVGSLDGQNGFILKADLPTGYLGESVNYAGDVDGDGIDDLIIGASFTDIGNLSNAGQSYVLFGKTGKFDSLVNLSNLNGLNGIVFNGSKRGIYSGVSVDSAGDVNNDGFDDLIIGAYRDGLEEFGYTGSAYIIFGRNFRSEITV